MSRHRIRNLGATQRARQRNSFKKTLPKGWKCVWIGSGILSERSEHSSLLGRTFLKIRGRRRSEDSCAALVRRSGETARNCSFFFWIPLTVLKRCAEAESFFDWGQTYVFKFVGGGGGRRGPALSFVHCLRKEPTVGCFPLRGCIRSRNLRLLFSNAWEYSEKFRSLERLKLSGRSQ